MAARQFILAADHRPHVRSQITYVNAYRRDHFTDLNVLTFRALRAKYRLPRAEIHRLLRVVSPHIRRPTRRNNALSPEVQRTFLRIGEFPGDGGGWNRAQQGFGVCRSFNRA